MAFTKGLAAAGIACIISSVLAIIAAVFILPFCIPSYVYSKDLEDFAKCDADGALDGWQFSYKSGYYFGLLNIIFVCASFGIACVSIIPGIGIIDFLLGLATSCGSTAFFILGIIVLVQGLSVNIDDLDTTKRLCLQTQYKCCYDPNNCSGCTYVDDDGLTQQCILDCKDEVVKPAEKTVKIIGSMLIVGSGMMAWYIITGSFTLTAAFGCCYACCDD